jgi:hypothetical protein
MRNGLSIYTLGVFNVPLLLPRLLSCSPMASMVGPNRQLLQTGALYSSTQVQEWLSPAGQRKSMPTNCRDDPALINNNTLR